MTTQQITHGSYTPRKKTIVSYEIPLYVLLNPIPLNLSLLKILGLSLPFFFVYMFASLNILLVISYM